MAGSKNEIPMCIGTLFLVFAFLGPADLSFGQANHPSSTKERRTKSQVSVI